MDVTVAFPSQYICSHSNSISESNELLLSESSSSLLPVLNSLIDVVYLLDNSSARFNKVSKKKDLHFSSKSNTYA